MKKRYNEYDENYALTYHQQVKAKKKRRIRKRLRRFLVLTMLIVFLLTPASKVNKINVKGLSLVDEATLLDSLHLSTSDIFLFEIPYLLEQKLLKVPGIEKASVLNLGFLGITIKVKEAPVVAHGSNSKGFFYLNTKGDVVYAPIEKMAGFVGLPIVYGVEDDVKLSNLAKALVNTPASVLSQISEIKETNDPFFADQLLLLMNDRKIVYVRVFNMAERLKYYNDVLRTYPDACQYNLDLAKNGIVKDCQ